jgi:hypothetical protein
MKKPFVKGQISVSFCVCSFLSNQLIDQESAFLQVSPCYPFHFSRKATFQFQENHQNRDLLAFVPATVEDDNLVNIRHFSKVMVPP